MGTQRASQNQSYGFSELTKRCEQEGPTCSELKDIEVKLCGNKTKRKNTYGVIENAKVLRTRGTNIFKIVGFRAPNVAGILAPQKASCGFMCLPKCCHQEEMIEGNMLKIVGASLKLAQKQYQKVKGLVFK